MNSELDTQEPDDAPAVVPFKVAIVGRPNVGKSTLFNRLVGKKLALVDDQAGVTRDRREADASLGDLKFLITDTAGLEEAPDARLLQRMIAQSKEAVHQADVCLFLVDARAGILPDDETIARDLRKSGVPVILAANKAEGAASSTALMDAFKLGLGEPIALSAEHGEGLSDLYDALAEYAPDSAIQTRQPNRRRRGQATDQSGDSDEAELRAYDPTVPINLAVVGRPNAGKSTLINQVLGEERLLTGPEAGITRDSISVMTEVGGRQLKIFDTAGMRKRARVTEKLEKLSVADGLRAVQFAEVVVMCVDATQPFEKQDLHIIDLVAREGRAIVIALNKWDLVEEPGETLKELRLEVERLLPQIRRVPVVPVSALTGQGLPKLFDQVYAVHETWNQRVSTARLNRWLEEAVARHPPPAVSGRRLKLRYATQAKTRPPSFVVFCSRPDAMPKSYLRYLINGLRDEFDLGAVPIRLNLRKRDNPYENKKRRK